MHKKLSILFAACLGLALWMIAPTAQAQYGYGGYYDDDDWYYGYYEWEYEPLQDEWEYESVYE